MASRTEDVSGVVDLVNFRNEWLPVLEGYMAARGVLEPDCARLLDQAQAALSEADEQLADSVFDSTNGLRFFPVDPQAALVRMRDLLLQVQVCVSPLPSEDEPPVEEPEQTEPAAEPALMQSRTSWGRVALGAGLIALAVYGFWRVSR